MGYLVASLEEKDGSVTMICEELKIRVTEKTFEEAKEKMSRLIDEAVGVNSEE